MALKSRFQFHVVFVMCFAIMDGPSAEGLPGIEARFTLRMSFGPIRGPDLELLAIRLD